MRYGDTRVSASLGVRDALDKEDCIALFPFQIYFIVDTCTIPNNCLNLVKSLTRDLTCPDPTKIADPGTQLQLWNELFYLVILFQVCQSY